LGQEREGYDESWAIRRGKSREKEDGRLRIKNADWKMQKVSGLA
jgi:hypothetical protein